MNNADLEPSTRLGDRAASVSPLYGISWAISALGDRLWGIAFPLYLLDLLHSPFVLSLALAGDSVIAIVVTFPAGILADRMSPKALLRIVPLISAILCVVFWLAHGTPVVLAGITIAVVLGLHALAALYDITLVSSIPRLFRSAAVTKVNSDLEIARSVAAIGGPLLGGILYAALGAPTLAAFDAASFVAVALAASALPAVSRAAAPTVRRARSRIREAAAWIWSLPSMRISLATSFFGNLVTALLPLAVILRLRDTYHLSPTAIGLCFALQAVGAVAGGLFMRSIDLQRFGSGRVLFAGFGVEAVSVAAAAFSMNLYLFVTALTVAGAAATTKAIGIVALRQRIAPTDLLGSIFACVRLVVPIGMTPAIILGGVVATRYGPQPLLWAASVAAVAGALAARLGPLYRERG